ncbi:MAG: hypothetical protein U0807_12350 [Candidatus Binatia bacterium]
MPIGRNKVTAATVRAVVLLAMFPGAGCGPDPSTARGAAERFLDAHYVAIDLRAARDLTSGLARQKLDGEIALVGDQQIDDTTRKPLVHYKLLSEHPEAADAASFAFLGQITVPDADSLERHWLVTVRREGGVWRVTNYQETAE